MYTPGYICRPHPTPHETIPEIWIYNSIKILFSISSKKLLRSQLKTTIKNIYTYNVILMGLYTQFDMFLILIPSAVCDMPK